MHAPTQSSSVQNDSILTAPRTRARAHALPWLLAFLAACSGEQDHGHSHAGDAHAAPAIERTAWAFGERTLVHLIHPPLVYGQPARSIVHGTRLEDGGPLHGARVTLVAVQGTSELRIEAHEEIPGHFPLTIELPETGAWGLRISVESNGLAEELDLGHVLVHIDRVSAAAEPLPQPSGAFDFLFEAQWEHGVALERVTPRPLTLRLSAPGRLRARPGGEAHVAAPLAGRLMPPENGALPILGASVAAGDVLARIEPPFGTSELVALNALEIQQHQLRHELDLQQLDAERALGAARARIGTAERELARAQRLFEQTLASQGEVDRVQGDLDLARSEERAALGSLASVETLREEHAHDPHVALPRIELRAPIAGTVAVADAVSGESVEAGKAIYTLLELSELWAVAEVSELELARLGPAPRALVRLPGSGERLPTNGPAVFISPRVDPLTRCVQVAFVLPNPTGALRANQACELELEVGARDAALTLTEEAIAWERGGPIAFVMVHGESFRKARLKLGARDAGRVEVLAGLAAGDVVVVRGAEELRLAALSGTEMGEGHAH